MPRAQSSSFPPPLPDVRERPPELPQPPPPDPVNHMQYAIEWFLLALIPLVGWPIALRRLLRRQVHAAP